MNLCQFVVVENLGALFCMFFKNMIKLVGLSALRARELRAPSFLGYEKAQMGAAPPPPRRLLSARLMIMIYRENSRKIPVWGKINKIVCSTMKLQVALFESK